MTEPLSQHFLTDPVALRRLVEAARLAPGESVLDLGAGEGSITALLSEAVGPQGKVIALELDASLAAHLRSLRLPNVDIVQGDALQLALPRCDAVVSNLPFHAAAALVLRLLDTAFGRALLVLPRELAERLTAAPGSERYGRLTVQVALRANVQRRFDVGPLAFTPPPRVLATVVEVRPRAFPAGVDAATLDALLAAAWASKGRTLRHGLAPLAAQLKLSSGTITEALRARDWEGKKPGELTPHDYAELALALRGLA